MVRDFIAAMGFVPNPRSNSGEPTVPKREPVKGHEEYDVNVPYECLYFMLPAKDWPRAHAAYEDPQRLVVYGGGGGGGGGAVGSPEEDDAAVLNRRHAEAQAAKRLARARGRAAQRAIEVLPCLCSWPARALIGCGVQNMDEVLAGVSYDMLWLYVDLNLRLRKRAFLDGSAKFHFWIRPAGLGKFPSNHKTTRRKANVRGQSALLERRPDPCMVDPARGAVAVFAGRAVERAVHDEGAGNRRCGQMLRGRSGDPAPPSAEARASPPSLGPRVQRTSVCAAFPRMVETRRFVERVQGERVPWTHGPVQPHLRRWAVGGVEVACADKAAMMADILPESEEDGLHEGSEPDGDYGYDSSDEDDPLRYRHPTAKGGKGGAEAGGAREPGCNRCGRQGHIGQQCPAYPRERGAAGCRTKAGARKRAQSRLASAGGGLRAPKTSFTVVPTPADGSCLFHSLTQGLEAQQLHGAGRHSASRAEIADWLLAHRGTEVAGVPLRDWIAWDSNKNWTVPQYAKLLRDTAYWGGELEIVACTLKCDVNVSIWRICDDEPSNYERTAIYEREGATATICLHYVGGRHYELLVPRARLTRGGAVINPG
jgi:hypothetical protein